jgi:hypothetical protein
VFLYRDTGETPLQLQCGPLVAAGAPSSAQCIAFCSNEQAILVGLNNMLRLFLIRPIAIETVTLAEPLAAFSVAQNNSYIRLGAASSAAPPKLLACAVRDEQYLISPVPSWPGFKAPLSCPACKKVWGDTVPWRWGCDCKDKPAERVLVWQPDTKACARCGESFGMFFASGSRHHARCCGRCLCANCSSVEAMLVWPGGYGGEQVRCCIDCVAERAKKSNSER